MDILNPDLVWIDGRCYRKLPIEHNKNVEYPEPTKSKGAAKSEDYSNEECDDSGLAIQHEGNRFFITIPVDSSLHGFIQGKKGQTRKRIEDQTSTQIKIPARTSDEHQHKGERGHTNRQNDTPIVIFGRSKKNVVNAYRKIENIAKDSRWKVGEYTHFISIPMNDKRIQERYLRFKKEVLTNYNNVRGINEKVFKVPAKLHLTIAMLTLLNNREKEMAFGLLQKHKSDILHLLGEKSLCVEIKGIEYMNDDPSEVDVLYGQVKETDSDNCLQIISDKLAEAFAKVDLSRKELRDHIKLHVTLMASGSSNAGRGTFDARKILQDYADYSFGQMTVSEIHISVRYTGGSEAYYTPAYILHIKN